MMEQVAAAAQAVGNAILGRQQANDATEGAEPVSMDTSGLTVR